MSDFDARARDWDKNRMHTERSSAIAKSLMENIPINNTLSAMEFGAGTGILSFFLKDDLAKITLIDNSKEMVAVCQEKCQHFNTKHITPLQLDLEREDLEMKFDIIYSQMALHHVKDVDAILAKLTDLLNDNGYLALADLCIEDGSFHGDNEDVHKGFDPELLRQKLQALGFQNVTYNICYNLTRESGLTYPIFLLTGRLDLSRSN